MRVYSSPYLSLTLTPVRLSTLSRIDSFRGLCGAGRILEAGKCVSSCDFTVSSILSAEPTIVVPGCRKAVKGWSVFGPAWLCSSLPPSLVLLAPVGQLVCARALRHQSKRDCTRVSGISITASCLSTVRSRLPPLATPLPFDRFCCLLFR